MVFCVIHVDPPCAEPEDEEVYVFVPGTGKTVMAVPLEALPQFLPLLEQAVHGLPSPQCAACTAAMPGLAVCSSPHYEPP
jgi:hypothetical protein